MLAENINDEKKIFLNFKTEKKSARNENLPAELLEAVNDSRNRKNLHGPFDSAEEAVESMLED